MRDFERIRLPAWRLRWAVFFFVLSIVVALRGEPQPLAILAAGAGALTGTVILLRGFEEAP